MADGFNGCLGVNFTITYLVGCVKGELLDVFFEFLMRVVFFQDYLGKVINLKILIHLKKAQDWTKNYLILF